jgi:hypothetical protein
MTRLQKMAQAELEVLHKQMKAEEAQRKAQEDADERVLKDSQEQINAINEKADALNEEVRTRHMLRSEIEAEKLALMEKDLIEFEGNDQALAQLEKKIAAQKRYIEALKGEEAAKAQDEYEKKAIDSAQRIADKSTEAFNKAWDQVGQSLADAIMDGGMNAKQFLERTFKSMVLRPVIQSLVNGAMGGYGAAQQGIYNPYTIGALWQSGMGLTIGNMAGTAYANSTGTGIDGLLSTNAAYGTAPSTLAGSIGGALPYLGALYMATQGQYGSAAGMAIGTAIMPGIGTVVGGLLGGLFDGHKGGPKAEGSAGYHSAALIGAYGNELDAPAQSVVDNLTQTYDRLAALLGSTRRTMQWGVGLSSDPRGTAPSFVQVANNFGGNIANTNVGRSEAEMQAEIARQVNWSLVAALRVSGIDQEVLNYFDKISAGLSDEGKLAAFESVAAMVNVWKSMKTLTDVVEGLGTISLDSAANLIKFSGGVENLTAGIAAYTQNFLKPEEQRKVALEQIAASMRASQVMPWATADMIGGWTRDTFKNLVDSLDLNSDTGQRAFSALMNVAGAFAQVTQETETTVSALKDYMDFITSLRTDENLSTLTPQERMSELMAAYAKAKNTANTEGNSQESISALIQATKALLEAGRDYYSSGAGYTQLFNMVNADATARGAAFPHANGLDRVPYDNYFARLHRGEQVLTAHQAGSRDQSSQLVSEIVALRREVSQLRQENRQDAGNTIQATLDAARQTAEAQRESSERAARTREYLSKPRPILA